MSETIDTALQDAQVVPEPFQREYARKLLLQFEDLVSNYPAPQPVQLLFTIDPSDTFNVTDMAKVMEESNTVPLPLSLEFTKAGYPIPDTAPLEKDVDQTWEI